jgi:hypothetical protein
MKDFDLKNYLLGFVSASIVAVVLYLVTMGKGSSDLQVLTVEQARQYYSNYHAHALPETEILKGFSFLTADYFQAAASIYGKDEGIVGYRTYMGVDDSGAAIGIMVGVDASGKDMTNDDDIIYGVRGSMGPCPNICDSSSPITN